MLLIIAKLMLVLPTLPLHNRGRKMRVTS